MFNTTREHDLGFYGLGLDLMGSGYDRVILGSEDEIQFY